MSERAERPLHVGGETGHQQPPDGRGVADQQHREQAATEAGTQHVDKEIALPHLAQAEHQVTR